MTATGDRYWNPALDPLAWEDVQARQAGLLGSTLVDVFERSPFYREKLAPLAERLQVPPEGAAAHELLEQLPFTTKDELRRAHEARTEHTALGRNQAQPTASIVQLVSSSGTSGQPVYYGLSTHDVERWGDGVANMFFTAGIRPDDVVVHLTSLPMVAGGLSFADGLRRAGATLAWMGGYTPERMLGAIDGVGATCLSATTSFLLYLTEHCEQLTGRAPSELGIRKLIGGGEPGLGEPEVREQLRRAWGAIDIREVMGLSDVMAGLWAECDAHAGMHFTGLGQVYAELIDAETGASLAWSEGAAGEVVYTTLARDATPLIRFRSGDQVVVEGVGCSCGRGAPRIRCLGRIDDMLIYKGMNVFPSAIRDVALRAGAADVTSNMRVWREHHLHVRFDDPIPVEIEAAAPLAPDAARAITERIASEVRKQLQVRVAVTLLDPGSLPRTAYKTSLLHTAEARE
jgi:phenylacetate-coenzyme A ligase PaaK-like adenylate-forming protein